MSFTSISCKNVFKTNKVLCNLHNKTKKIKPNPKYHSVYLGIYYKGAGEDLFKTTKEIERHHGNTVCRINIGGNNEPYKAVFFLLDDLKTKTRVHKLFNKTVKILKKIFTTDIILEEDNLNPIKTDKIEKIEQTTHHPELYNV